MNPIFAAAAELEDVCSAAGFRYCFIGGIAVGVPGHATQRLGQAGVLGDWHVAPSR
jgi:hypothetical protein